MNRRLLLLSTVVVITTSCSARQARKEALALREATAISSAEPVAWATPIPTVEPASEILAVAEPADQPKVEVEVKKTPTPAIVEQTEKPQTTGTGPVTVAEEPPKKPEPKPDFKPDPYFTLFTKTEEDEEPGDE